MCDEVTLPGVQSSTGSVNRYAGANPVYYPTNTIYNDIQLSFMCDAEMQALNFLNDWYDRMFGETVPTFFCEGNLKVLREKKPKNLIQENIQS